MKTNYRIYIRSGNESDFFSEFLLSECLHKGNYWFDMTNGFYYIFIEYPKN